MGMDYQLVPVRPNVFDSASHAHHVWATTMYCTMYVVDIQQT